MDFIKLPLDGTKNTRDLGGIPISKNERTKFHVFVRSDRLTDLTDDDNEFLKEYGIKNIIDFRGVTEIQDTFVSDDNINKNFFKFYYVPLSIRKFEMYSVENRGKEGFDLGIAYTYLIENKIKIKEVFDLLANLKGGTLFHCSGGRGRTGIIAALLLGLCGVCDKDIITNYEVTYTYVYDATYFGTYYANVKSSKAQYMRTFIENLKEKYGTFERYLLSCDISKENLEKIKEKFIEKE